MKEVAVLRPRSVLAPAVGLAVLALAAAPSAAQATVVCFGTQTTEYSPGVTLEPREVTITFEEILSSCVSPTDPSVTSGRASGSRRRMASCLELLGERVYTWSNNRRSTFRYTTATVVVGGVRTITHTGTIVSGQFEGDTAVEVFTQPALNTQDCLGEGVTRTTGLAELTALSPP
jgi:hypothetical protein